MGREKVTISEFISVITEYIIGDDNEIGGILQKLGIMPNYYGYDYLKAAIETGIQNPNLLLKDVYAKVAKEFDVSVYSVDQNIKIAIKSSNSKRNHDFFIKLFKEDITPTSKKFIFTVAGYIKVNRILSNNRHHQL